MNKVKLVPGVSAALVVVLLGGWLWGTSLNRDLNRALKASALQTDLIEARSSVLAAQLDLYRVNLGDASRHLEYARGALRRAEEELKSLGRQDEVNRLGSMFTQIDEALRLASQLDQHASSRAAKAVITTDAVLGTEVTRQGAHSRTN